MLYSKSIHADTLSVIVEEFRQGLGAGFTPINSIGVRSKIDEIWGSDSKLNPLIEAKKTSKKLMERDIVKNTLYNIYPITALLALGGQCLEEKDVEFIKELCNVENILNTIFEGESDFRENKMSISEADRNYLADKFGRFGIYLMVDYYIRNKDVSIEKLKELLLVESGYMEFMKILTEHFCERANLIKIHSTIFTFSKKCRTLYKQFDENTKNSLICEEIIKKLDQVIRIVKLNFQSIDIATAYYEGKLRILETQFDEFRRVSGEFGYSCIERLNLSNNDDTTIDKMRDIAMSRIKHWNEVKNIEGAFKPSNSPFYILMIKLYEHLYETIKSSKYKLTTAFDFLYGRKYE